ncbi:MAG: HlyC/CorC family transporter [Actinomyces graevenitzii]|nr:HlyC/CorC family transporter [Actinomyces graevenitzii]
MVIKWLMIVLGVLLTAGTAVFVAGEFALVALDPSVVDARAQAGDKRAGRVSKALRHLSTLLSGAQVGITLTTILLGYTMQAALNELLSQWLSPWLGQTLAATIAVVSALIIVNAFSMVFGELIPKNATLADPLAAAGFVTPFITGFTWLFRPLVNLLNGMANALLSRFGIEAAEEASGARSAGELTALLRRSAEEGTLDRATARLLTRSIGVDELSAVDVMTDRGRIHWLEESSTAADLVALASQTGHSRFPVFGDSPDDVLGLVNLRRAIAVPYERRAQVPVTSSSIMTPAPRVPETMPLASLLVELRGYGEQESFGLQMAIVVDEYGGTAGVVTLEDAVEEIVGEVSDEHDRRRAGIHLDSAGRWIAPGWSRPDEVTARTAIRIPDDGPYETLGGLVMNELGRIPQIGDEVTLPTCTILVDAMEGRRVTRVRITPVEQELEALQ